MNGAGAGDMAVTTEELEKLLNVALNGTGVDLKTVKGPRAVLLAKQERQAQKEASEKFAVAAKELGPRQSLFSGSPTVFNELLELSLGKRKGTSEAKRLQAFCCLESVAWATPVLIDSPLKGLLALNSDKKFGDPALAAASSIIAKFTPSGHGIVQLVLPSLLEMVDDKNWKLRVFGMKLLPSCLGQMKHTTKQLSQLLSRLLPQLLAGPLLEPRKEIQDAAREVLEVIGKLVRNSEVSSLSNDVVRAVADPANQKYTQEVLAKLGSTTFMNYIDAASLALLFPIMNRGLKEREQKSRKWSAQILGAIVTLVKDIAYLRPYLPTLLPLLKECAIDPTYEIQREAAKAFGMLTQELPEWSRCTLQPWLCEGVRSKDLGEMLGCSHAFSEVLLRLGKKKRSAFVSAIIEGARSPDSIERRGYLTLLDFVVEALKNDFVPFLRNAFHAMMAGMLPEPEDPGWRAATGAVSRFGASCPELLLPALEDVFFYCRSDSFIFPTALKHEGVYKPAQHWVMRECYLKIFQQICDKILDHRKYGQDMLTCEDCSSRPVRESILVLLEVLNQDPHSQVQRQSKHIFRHCGGQAKVTKEIMPSLEAKLLQMRQDPVCGEKRKAADSLLASLAEAGEIGEGNSGAYIDALPSAPPLEDAPQATTAGSGHARLLSLLGVGDATAAAPESSDLARTTEDEVADEDENREEVDRESLARHAFRAAFSPGSWDEAGNCGEAVRCFCETMAASVAVEALSSRGLFGELKPKVLSVVFEYVGGVVSEEKVNAMARSVAKAVFGENSLTEEEELKAEEEAEDLLLRVDDLMLMYGGGHLLLKDTVLEIKRNHRYGVIGHNGCGKTTLMKELQACRVAGMPKDIRCVHVSDADLGNMKVLEMSSISFVERDMPEGETTLTANDALERVGFPKEMQDKAVSELSGGWRMRLLLACAMMKQADILLLDEPTNHLDVHAIEWLCEYLLSVKTGALMVISHDPHFLNAVCTDIVQYREKRLVYYKGNFDAFKQANKITDDDAEVLLAGNLNLDKAKPTEDSEGAKEKNVDVPEGGEDAKASEDAALVDALANEPKAAAVKLVFPIPGKLDGIRNNSKPVMEIRDVYFEYEGGKGQVIKGVSARLSLGSRVALVGVNGAGKSTLLGLMCGELNPTEHEGKIGDVWQHHNLRLSFIAQHHMTSLGRWYESSPFTYLSYRFQNGWDEEAQRHLLLPKDEEEARIRKEKASIHGKYGRLVGNIVGRSKQQGKLVYEVQWEGMEDQKQNTFETLDKLRQLGVEGHASACNLRLAATAAGVDTRPCSRREIVKHLEQFGIDEEMCCNRLIGGFSAGQKSKLALACAMWTKPHLLALDEPTNYLDLETVESLARALRNFRGGVVVVTHSRDFIQKVCNEEWDVAAGKVTVNKLEAPKGK
eukprot:TRINITY_DN55139_c0_g1_i1.p1 TRINITY_DN55139_c0_g1~~TRINITY_DN55139_c0_g1_i1.p1  ORF type:complete len:1408 (-),score=281.64 TRINITY_DN55139_c0_g1_i1:363-4586(-)